MTAAGLEHRESARLHCIRRVFERHGIALGVPDLIAIEERIRRCEAKFIRDDETNRKLFRVPFKGHVLFVIFDFNLNCLVTALQKNWAEEPKRKITGQRRTA